MPMNCLSDADLVLMIRALDARELQLHQRADRAQETGMLDVAERNYQEAVDARELRLRLASDAPRGPEAHAALEKYLGPLKKG